MPGKKRVSYVWDPDTKTAWYGENHPMKPQRLSMTHELVQGYGMLSGQLGCGMQVVRPVPATKEYTTLFHSQQYMDFLESCTEDAMKAVKLDGEKPECNVGQQDDVPFFDGVWDYSTRVCGGTVLGANMLCNQDVDIAIHWAGGLHHAKRTQASGFCYINDIVFGILELMKTYKRVLYIDIDCHHGDGVEEAFLDNNRVFTVSFHKFGDFFPGTGDADDCGVGKGKGYAVNVPLSRGIDDQQYRDLFQRVIGKVMERFRPEAVVLQCGADSLAHDRLGQFNLSLEGHGDCVRFMKAQGLPLLLLGGGGYTTKNVARCWAYETAIATDCDLDVQQLAVPQSHHVDYYKNVPTRSKYGFKEFDTLSLEPDPTMQNFNTPDRIEKIFRKICENLKNVEAVPNTSRGVGA